MRTPLPIPDRLIARSVSVGECLVWQGATDTHGYGQIAIQGKPRRVHVVAYEISHGLVPDGLMVRHTCDNPPCWRIDHLVTGTAADNSQDAVERGRSRKSGNGVRVVVRTVSLDDDMPAWLAAEARRKSTSISTIVRQLVRAAMGAEAEARKRVWTS